MKNLSYLLFLGVLFVSCGADSSEENTEVQHYNSQILPFIGPFDVVQVEKDGQTVNDTIWHVVPDYVFTRHDSSLFTNENVKGKIHVANFFFTSCPAICPAMTEQMRRLQENTSDIPEIQFLSHSIDPKRDTIPKLLKFINDRNLNTDNWSFLYDPEKSYVHDLAQTGYMINAMEDEEADGGFLHSEHFILVDREGHIRGLYVGTDIKEIDQLEKDIRKLINEQYGEN